MTRPLPPEEPKKGVITLPEPSFTVTPNPAYGLECVIKDLLNVEELIINPVDILELVEALNRYYYHEFMTKEGD